ncbi:hypothetical protein B0H66DRAFT_526697 [Apodospora peruviana]|uniref:Uncharacterized protein n=1 Tax=Apodospora peruviana TaxID=516989 RepID=A0AAE0IQR0_9PEZI|nr:hypothetical protein B0H66DRAFT_526697 [Apodospora peruviana]
MISMILAVPGALCNRQLDHGRAQSTEHRAQSTEHRAQNRAQSTEHRAQSTEHRAQSTEHRAQSTEHRAQSTEHRAQSIEHRAEEAKAARHGGPAQLLHRQLATYGGKELGFGGASREASHWHGTAAHRLGHLLDEGIVGMHDGEGRGEPLAVKRPEQECSARQY